MWQDSSNDPEQLPRFADTLRLFSRRLGWEFGAFCAWVAVEAELVAGAMVIVDVGRSHRPFLVLSPASFWTWSSLFG